MSFSKIVLAGLLAVSFALIAAPWFIEVNPLISRTAGVVLLAIGLWSTSAIAEYLTAIIFIFLVIVIGLAKPDVVFSGFHSGAAWLIFGGLFIGLAVQKSGLGKRLVNLAIEYLSGGYAQAIIAVCCVGLALSFFIPSAIGRVMLLLPIVIAFADRLGFKQGSKGYIGLILAVGMGITMPAFNILPSNVPNMALSGAAESIHGVVFKYADYFVLNFTVMGVLAFLLIPILLIIFFNDTSQAKPFNEKIKPWSRNEIALLVILAATVGFWASDFLHGISPAWIALGAAIICLLPRVGVLAASDINQVNFGPWIFVAGVIGLGAVANQTGLADVIGQALLSHINLGGAGGFEAYLKIVSIGMVVSIFTGHPAAPAIMTPLATGISEATGWPLTSVLLAQVPCWVIYLLPYQAPPMLVAITMGKLPLGPVMKIMAVYFVAGVIVILPAHYVWGRYLGYWP